MDINLKIPFGDEIQAHVEQHKTAYLVGISIAATYIVTRTVCVSSISVAPVINNMPTFNNDNSSLVNFGGHMTKIVKRMSDGKMWESVTEAAAEEGCTLSKMSRHLNGHNPHVYGEVYQLIGVGTTG